MPRLRCSGECWSGSSTGEHCEIEIGQRLL